MNFLIASTAVIAAHLVYGLNYCEINCSGHQHIACNNDGGIHSGCPNNTRVYEFSKEEIEHILHVHNDLRNSVANGSLSGFKSASRMARLVWDDELAYLANLNTRNCTFGHDHCRNTKKFKVAGQNLAMISRSYQPIEPKTAIDRILIKLWFDEYKYANMTVIDKFRTQTNKVEEYGHFTQFVTGNSTAVGCGATIFNYHVFHQFYMACNYGRSNVLTTRVYDTGPIGMDCKSGTDKLYPALCKIDDPSINPNYLFE